MRHCLCLDLKDDAKLIAEYEEHHTKVWPEVLLSLENAGILSAEIYRWKNRIFMILETKPGFTFEEKLRLDAENEKVLEWEKLMWKYQKTLPGVKEGSKWQLMKKIFTM
ncbi:MAG TPA: L-rhamnose mutarotase [Anditalea sp.]|nr:L-rhamnose mutarotase [Anditalea sp.]